jgi:ParB family chromosome partitioning protein
MKNQKFEMILPTADELFTTQEERDYMKAEKVEEISIEKIHDFPNHPFKVIDDEKMESLVESIKERGVLSPAIVRPREDGTYEMISGHRRKHASILAGKDTLRCLVKNLTDDEATILMVDSNIQREELLPSEKAFAYKMKLDALRHQGKRSDLTLDPVGPKLQSTQEIGKENDESMTQVKRYIRLTNLIPELLAFVDEKKIGFRTAVELSYLSEFSQEAVYDYSEQYAVIPSLSQAVFFKKEEQAGTLTEDTIESTIQTQKPNQAEKIVIHVSDVREYFPRDCTNKEMQDIIKELLQNYKKQWLTKDNDLER